VPSQANSRFSVLMESVDQLRQIHGRLQQGRGRRHQQESLHRAGVVMTVAAWESYVESVLREGMAALQPAAGAPNWAMIVQQLAMVRANAEAAQLHTPNAENVRRLFETTIVYNPHADWHWTATRRNWTGPQVSARLNEWLRIRHSVAHGGDLPSNLAWIQSSAGDPRLTLPLLRECARFFGRLVAATDAGLSSFLNAGYGIARPW
jgi:hypothetical protein